MTDVGDSATVMHLKAISLVVTKENCVNPRLRPDIKQRV